MLTLALGWACAELAIAHGIYDADTIIRSRNVFYALTVVSCVMSVVLNLGDIGNGPLCTVGRFVMPLADALYIGKRLRRFARKQALRDPTADYQADMDRKRRYAADKERQGIEGPAFTLPWNRGSDAFKLRRYLEIAVTLAFCILYWLMTIAIWNIIPSFLSTVMIILGIAFSLLAAIHVLFLLVTNKPADAALTHGDSLLALLRRKRR